MTSPQHSAADFMAAERRRTAVYDHHQRITQCGKLKEIIAEEMSEATQQVLSDLLAAYSAFTPSPMTELARRLHVAQSLLSRLKNGQVDCSHELFVDLFRLWKRLPANMQGQPQ
jgi:DNA-nicking Smr family endonuclease